jgi:hypothetical protein
VPTPPEDFPESAEFALTRDEAEYLVDRIALTAPRTLLAFLARRGAPTEVPSIWMHPQLGEFPAEVAAALEHARLFAETIRGAAWLYNVLLAEERARSTGDGTRALEFRNELAEWATEVSARSRTIENWDRAVFWSLVRERARVGQSTQSFVEAWLRLEPWQLPGGGADDKSARALVRGREQQLKGPRSRFTSPRALELWGGASGTALLDYRWNTTNRLLADVYAALGRGGSDA